MKQIEHCSRLRLECKTIPLSSDIAIISINDPESEAVNLTHYKDNPIYHFFFHDIDEEASIYWPHPISQQQANEILEVLLKHNKIIVHCQAGWSRSPAVCRFARDFLGFEWVTQDVPNCPNKLVLELLEKTYVEGLNAKYSI